MPSSNISRRRLVLGLPLLAAANSLAAQTTDYPNRAIRFIVPSGPSTGFDILARALGQKLGDKWGVPHVVENKPGASGNIGMELAAKSPPDGYTLLVTANIIVQNRSLYKNVPFDPIKDFAPIAALAVAPMALVVHPSVKAANVKELVALIKANPAGFSYASPGNGSPHHMAMEMLKLALGFEATHIPYKTTPSILPDLISGRVAFMFLPLHAGASLIESGKINVLCAGGNQRAAAMPNVPSLAEAAGVQNVDVDIWYAMYAPAGTPQAIVDKLNLEVDATLRQPDVRAKLAQQGLSITGGKQQYLADLTRRDLERWSNVVRDAKIKAD
jgi:tripartite-type tricarboxylate transporter receptor subunit TctC